MRDLANRPVSLMHDDLRCADLPAAAISDCRRPFKDRDILRPPADDAMTGRQNPLGCDDGSTASECLAVLANTEIDEARPIRQRRRLSAVDAIEVLVIAKTALASGESLGERWSAR